MSRTVRPASSLNFVNWSLGHETRWPVRVSMSSAPSDVESFARRNDMLYRRWITIRDGRQLVADLLGAEVTLEFLHPSHLREARQWIRTSPRPFLQRLELSNPFVTESEGELFFVRGALPGRLEGRLYIVVPSDLPVAPRSTTNDAAEQHPNESGEVRLRRFSAASSVTVGVDELLIAASPLLPVDNLDAAVQPIIVFLTTGERLLCRVEGPPGSEYLRVTSIEIGERRAGNARFLAVAEGVHFVGEAPAAGADLTPLQPRPHDNLAFWIQYEREALRRSDTAFERRYSAPLEYDEATRDASSDSWLLRLVNGQAALSAWTEQAGRAASREIDVDASVELRALDGAGESRGGTLLSLSDADGTRVVARVRVDRPEVVPVSPGKIIAVEERGDARQRERRNQALRRLQTGGTGSPELLQWLYAPQLIPGVNSRADVIYARAGHARRFEGMQSLAIRGAAQCPGIFLVQGPPGTGKTSVIVEIVHELRRRYRKRQERGPIRVLIASVQNEAVHNVVERLQMDRAGLQVQTTWLRESEALSHALAEKSKALAARARDSSLARTPEFERYVALRGAYERARALLDELGAYGLTSDVIGQLRDVVSAENVRAVVSPLLLGEMGGLLEQLNASSSDPGESDEAIHALRAICALDPPRDPTTQAQALDILDAMRNWPADLAERLHRILLDWRRLRPLVTVALDAGPLAAKLQIDWAELVERTRSVLSAEDTEGDDKAGEDGFRHSRLEAVSNWTKAALQATESELRARESSLEAAIFDWIQSVERAPREMAGVMNRYAPVTAATCQRAALAAPSEQVDESDFFDVAIIDEAARAGIDVLIPMTLARSVVLVGDQLQLPPYVEDDLVRRVDQGVLDQGSIAEPLFTYLWRRLPPANRVSLTTQYRMHEEIGRIVSKVFYEPDIVLSHYYSGERAHERTPEFGLLDDEPVAWIDTADVLQSRGAGGYDWPCHEENPYEADIVLNLLSRLRLTQLLDTLDATGSPPVGVISFYRAQKDRLEANLRMRHPELERLIDIGTVDGFQGREFPLVILSCVRSNASGNVGFLSRLPQRINVAMSRAQRQLIVVGDASTLAAAEKPASAGRSRNWLRKVHGMIAEKGRVYPSAAVVENA